MLYIKAFFFFSWRNSCEALTGAPRCTWGTDLPDRTGRVLFTQPALPVSIHSLDSSALPWQSWAVSCYRRCKLRPQQNFLQPSFFPQNESI